MASPTSAPEPGPPPPAPPASGSPTLTVSKSEKSAEASAMESIRLKQKAEQEEKKRARVADEEARRKYEAQKEVLTTDIVEAHHSITLNSVGTIFDGANIHEGVENGKEGRDAHTREVLELMKNAGAKARFRAATKEKNIEAAEKAAAEMLVTAWRAKAFKNKMNEKRARMRYLIRSGAARKMQRLYRMRAARKLIAERSAALEELDEEEEMRILMDRSDSYCKAMKHEDISVTFVPELVKGFIKKEGQVVRTMKNRFFVLKANASGGSDLKYYVNESAKEPFGVDEKGSLLLKGAFLNDLENLTLVLTTEADKRDLKMCFSDLESMVLWKNSLQSHIDYSNKITTTK